MNTYVEFLLLGLGNGGVFAALAMALVVTYRSSGVLNFATGAQALYAAYTYSLLRNGQLLIPIPGIGPTVSVGSNLGFWPALLITLAIQAVMGAVVYLLVFRPLRNHRPVAKAVASIGLMGLLTAIVTYQVGTQVVLVNPIFPQNHVSFLGVSISTDRLWLAGTIIALGVVLTVIFRFTRFGLATRASAETEVGALVSGLSPDRIALVNWIISFVVSGIAGILIAPLVPLQPGTYTLFIVPALAAAVVGRFHSLGWAITAGLGIGALESLSVYVNGVHPDFPAGAGELIPLILVLVVLAVRGQTMPSRGTLMQVTLGRAPRPHWRIATAIVGTAVGIGAIYLFTGNDRAALYASFITGVISLSLVVVTGYTGQISLAQLTLAGVSAYILSTFASSWGIPFPIAPILSALVAAAAGVVIGIPALRVRGLMLGVVTLTFAAGVEAIWFNNNSIDGGASGLNIPTPTLFGMNLGIGSGKDFPRPAFGILCLIVLVLVALGVSWLRTSRLGTAMLAVRSDERSAAAAGINVVRVKLIGFAIGAFIAGLGGSLLAYQLGNVTFQDFDAFLGLVAFSIVVVAGITSVSGGILAGMISSGGLLVALISTGVGSGGVDNWYGVVAGIGVILTVIFNPEGVVGPTHVFLEQQRTKRALARPRVALVPAVATAATATTAPARAPEPLVAPVFGTNGHIAGAGASSTTTPSDKPLLEVRNLTVRYGGVTAVDDVSLSVSEGQIVGLIGPNGAGKTTTIDALCGFHGCEGTVLVNGRDVGGCPPHIRAALGLARTFQLAGVSDDLTVAENVEVGQQRSRGNAAEVLDRILDDLGLTDMRELQVSVLSQGQRQLVSVARALAGEPKLLLLDEPAAGLDSTESLWLAERLRAVRDSGVTILLVDHDMSLVLNLCDSIDVLDFGALIAHGTPDEIGHNEVVSTAYLGATHQRLAGVVSDTTVLDGDPATGGAGSASEEPVLEVKGLDVGYGKLTVARDITFSVQPRTVLTILGPNGAGKTTLLMTLAGFLPPRAGTIALNGQPVPGSSPRRMNRAGLVLVPDFRALFTELTPIQNLKLAAKGADLDPVLQLFPALQRREKLRVGDLSGGEQQMLAIARALVQSPKLLLIDEMSMGLAPVAVESLMPVIRQVADEHGASVIMVEQHVQLALEAADEAMVLVHGSIVLSGPAERYRNDTRAVESAYMSGSVSTS